MPSELTWDEANKRKYETGVSNGVLYPQSSSGTYPKGVAWNGLISVTESPSGAESTPLYADNIKYLNLLSAEDFGATIEAYTYPDEFGACNGESSLIDGVSIGQQTRVPFGMSYQTKVGTAANPDAGYKIHIIYGAQAAPSEKAYQTVNDSPEAITFSWELTTTAVAAGAGVKPTAKLEIDSTKLSDAKMTAIKAVLYGSTTADARLPLPSEIVSIINAVTEPAG